MSPWVIGFLVALGLVTVWLVRVARRAGPRQVSAEDLARARPLLRVTPDDPGPGWTGLGSATHVDGIRLRFEADDDPAAEATLLVPGREGAPHNALANRHTIRLAEAFETHHVHTGWRSWRSRAPDVRQIARGEGLREPGRAAAPRRPGRVASTSRSSPRRPERVASYFAVVSATGTPGVSGSRYVYPSSADR